MITSPIAGFAEEKDQTTTIKASAGRGITDCFSSLDATDMENLGGIIYNKNNIQNSMHPQKNIDYELQRKDIDKTFTGEKKIAALAILSNAIAKSNEAVLKQVMNKAIDRVDHKVNDEDKKLIGGMIEDGKKNGVDLEKVLNTNIATLSEYAIILKSKGAKITPEGNWSFDDKFNFAEMKSDPKLKSALEAFFPDEVNELSQDSRGFAIIGNRVVKNIPDPTVKKNANEDTSWIWESANIEDHFNKILGIQDRFVKKAEEYARTTKKNSNWIVLTGAALDSNISCGFRMTSLIPGLNNYRAVLNYINGKNDNLKDSWDKGLDSQLNSQEELGGLIIEMSRAGATQETIQVMRDQYALLRSKSEEDMEAGLKGMKRSMTAIACAPLAVIAAPIALPAAGTTGAALAVGYAGTALTAISLATPLVIAGINIKQAYGNGDGFLCSTFKEASMAGVKTIETLRWGAMGPLLKKLAPGADKLINYIKPKPVTLFLATHGPSVALVTTLTVSKVKSFIKNAEVRNKLEEAIKIEESVGNKAHADVLKEILKAAKEDKFDLIVDMLSTSVSIHEIVTNAFSFFPLKAKAIPANITEEVASEAKTASRSRPSDAANMTTNAPGIDLHIDHPANIPSLPAANTATATISKSAELLPEAAKKTVEIASTAVETISEITTTYKDAKDYAQISVNISEIHPAQGEVSKEEVAELVKKIKENAAKLYPNNPKAMEEYMKYYMNKNLSEAIILPDGTLMIKKDQNTIQAYQALIDEGLLNKNEFKVSLKINHNYLLDPKYNLLSKDAGMSKAINTLIEEGDLYFSPNLKEEIRLKKTTAVQAFASLPKNSSSITDRPLRKMVNTMENEAGINFAKINQVVDFYTAENLAKNDIKLPKKLNPKSSLDRALILKQLSTKQNYIDQYMASIPHDSYRNFNIMVIQNLAKNGEKFYSAQIEFTNKLIKANPNMKEKILAMDLLSLQKSGDQANWQKAFMDNAVDNLGLFVKSK